MRMDLALGLAHGFYAGPLLLLALRVTSTDSAEHPLVWWSFTAWMVLANIGRAVLVLWRDRLYARFPALWWSLLGALTASISAAIGAFLACNAWWYPIENWNMLAPLLFALGEGAASLITMTPSYRLLRAHVLLVFVPVTSALAWMGEGRSWAFGIGGACFVAFLLVQGRALHRNYAALRWEQGVSRKRAKDLEQARRDAEAASDAKSQFLASLSHEIRTPMNGILGMARLALDEEPAPAVRELIETLEQCAFGLLGILNDMLDFSKIEAGKLALERIPFSPHDLLEEAAGILAPEAKLKGLALKTSAPAGRIWVEGDPVRLRQVLVNLIGNAVKFTSTGDVKASFEVVSSPADEGPVEIGFAVEDSGIGIDPSSQNVIFEAFRQADGSVTRRFGGTGLGLAICARIVELMGGKIQVESTPGAGSRFSFRCRFERTSEQSISTSLHRATEELMAAMRVPDQDQEPVLPLSILVAEDNPVNQRLLERLLTRQGHRVVVAANGSEALDAVRDRATHREDAPFDLILMDISMPEMDGMEATRLLREQEIAHESAPIPIVALTANAMQGDRERFMSAGMDGYLAKPFSAEKLHEVISRYSVRGGSDKPVGSHSSYSS